MEHPVPDLVAVVPAGGAGTRLWPLSRAARPKFLLDLTGTGATLLQQTWDRLAPLTGGGGSGAGILVVTGQAHRAAVSEQLPGLVPADLLAEPSPRDSAAAIGLAAAVVLRRRPDAVVGSFAADHVVRDVPAFSAAVREAVAVARQGWVVTIGIEPSAPSTGFGYVRAGAPLAVGGAPSALAVERFVEKPDAHTARAYLAEGGYRWNAGMFVARASVLVDELARHRPALAAGLEEIAAAWDTPAREEVLTRVWPTLEKVAIDYAVAEPAAAAGRVAVVPAEFGWDDVGDFAALAAITGPAVRPGGDDVGADGRLTVLGDAACVHAVDSTGLVVPAGGRTVAVVGLRDVVVVDTPDGVLVTSRARAQDVKAVVEALKAQGRADLL